MALALVLLLDGAASGLVRAAWDDLAARGISTSMVDLGYPPHLTLVVTEDETLAPALDRALPDLAGAARLDLELGPVARFAGGEVVYLACRGERLAAMQAEAARLVPAGALHAHSRPDSFVPHVTLQTAGHAEAALQRGAELWPEPIPARATAIELVRFPPIVALRRLGV